jgi:hypothetical protein
VTRINTAPPGAPDARPAARLADLLAGLLLACPACRWPGADGLTVGDLLREYPAAASARLVPSEAELCDRHPDLAAQVVAFFFLQAAGCSHEVASE